MGDVIHVFLGMVGTVVLAVVVVRIAIRFIHSKGDDLQSDIPASTKVRDALTERRALICTVAQYQC